MEQAGRKNSIMDDDKVIAQNESEESETKEKRRFNKEGLVNYILLIGVIVIIAAAAVVIMNGGFSSGVGTGVVFNEIVTDNKSPVVNFASGSPDWIELYNTSDKDISLSGYKISDDKHQYIFGDSAIKAGEYILVYTGSKDTSASSIINMGFGLSSAGEKLTLTDSSGNIAGKVVVPSLKADEAYARRSDGTYGYSIGATPGKQNDNASIKDRGELDSEIEASNVIVSEILPKGRGGESWVELYNAGGTAVNLANFFLTDSEADTAKWHITKSMLEPEKYAVIYMAGDTRGSGEIQASFGLSGSDNGVYLYDINGGHKSSLKWENGIPGGVSIVADNTYTIHPTMGEKNSSETFSPGVKSAMDASDPVLINEVLKNNEYGITDENGLRSGWAELYNSSTNDVTLSGYYLSDDGDDLFKWAFPDTVVKAGEYLTVFFTGEQEKQQQLHVSFKLSGSESCLYLTNIKGMRIDSFNLPVSIGTDISAGRGKDGNLEYYSVPTPGGENNGGTPEVPQKSYPNRKNVYINEVCAVNKAKSAKNDWIELYNGSGSAADLKGYYLSDDKDNIKKWQITSLTIGAGCYAVIEASPLVKQGTNTAAFGISPEGETLLLSDPSGTVIDVFETGVLTPGVTSGRLENGGSDEHVFFSEPTPGKANKAEYNKGYTAVPEFSETGLYHTKAFSLSIASSTQGASIYYTTNGSVPTKSSKVYTGPISIKRNIVIRAVAYADGLLPSAVKTSTFIFDKPSTLPVVCLSGKPSEIKTLLRINHKAHDRKPEYKANFEYYENDGTLGVSFVTGLKPKGNYSMNYRQKSFVIRLRNSYGQGQVTYPFFEDSKVTTFNALSLRSSGQDYPFTRIRDAYFQRVAKGLNLETLNVKFVRTYINGEYYGLYDLEEEQNEAYITSYFGVKSGNIDVINRDGTALHGNSKEFSRIENIARNKDLSDDKVFAEFSKYVDIDAFTDFLVMQIYFASGDVSNLRYWRARDYSVKWRPMLHDLDWAMRFADGKGNAFPCYFNWHVTSGRGEVTYTSIFSALKENKAWREKFIERYVELAETQFSSTRILPIYDSLVSQMKPEMPRHIKKYHKPPGMGYWQGRIRDLRSAIAKRKGVALAQLQRYFHISDAKIKALKDKYSTKQ